MTAITAVRPSAELATGRSVVACDNVLPRRGEVVPGPARAALAELYRRHAIGGRGPAVEPGRATDAQPWRSRNASVRSHASADSSANSSCLRSKNECGAPGYVWISCSTGSAASHAATWSAVMFWSAPAWRARIGAWMAAASCSGPGLPRYRRAPPTGGT